MSNGGNSYIWRTGASIAALATAISAAPALAQAAPDGPGSANAAQSAATQPGDASAQEIVVTGFRSSLAKALTLKKDADTTVDSILAEDIGKFPDLNLSESIQRIPGVALSRDAGEGREISVRGLGAQFTRVRINGMEALATTGSADSSGGTNRGRSFDFNVFASDLFNEISVRKTADAQTEEGSLGATVDLRTARPFDYKGFTIAASAQGSYNDLAKKADPRGAFMIADQTADGRFGALFSVAYTKRDIIEEGYSTVRWAKGSSFAPGFESALGSQCVAVGANGASGAAVTPAPANCVAADAALHPRFPRYDLYKDSEKRLGATASFQFKPTENTLISLDGLYADFKAQREEQYLEAPSFSVAGACTAASRLTNCGIADTDVTAMNINSQGIMTSGTFNDVDLRVENRLDHLDTKFKQVTLEGTQKLGKLTLNAMGGWSSSDHENPIQNTVTLDQFNVDGYSFDYTDQNHPVFNFGDAQLTSNANCATPTSSKCWQLSQLRLRAASAKNTYYTGQFDAAWEAVDGLTLKAGYDYKKYTFVTHEWRRSNGTTSNQETVIPATAATTPLSQYTHVISIGGVSFLDADYRVAQDVFKLTDPTAFNGAFKLGPEPALGNNGRVGESDNAGYFQADFRHEFGGVTVRGNAGVRYVDTKQSSTGYGFVAGALQTVTTGRSYGNWLPAANLAVEATDKLVFRLAAADVIARPNLTQLTPGVSVSVSGATRSVTVGNPDLDPFKARTYDASVEWYFSPGALISVALFQKNIGTFVQTQSSTGTFTGNPFGLPDSLAIAACGNLYPTTCSPTQNNWTFSSPSNTPGGKLRGFEINYQQPFKFLPGLLSNTGVLLNYTQVTSKINYLNGAGVVVVRTDLTNLSKRSANGTLYYEDKFLSARVSAAYRSKYLTTVPGTEVGTTVQGTASTLNVDASIQLTITKQIKLTFEGINLTNEAQDQYIEPGDLQSVYHKTGREYLAGIRFNL
jgi:iron complex outermembrane receptor protein